jgi:Coenzyme PQQ synthesis protein D (PqqD)
MLFRKKKRPALTAQQSLAARPVRLIEGRLTAAPDGGGKLQVPLHPRRFAGWLVRVPDGATKTFELDALGMLVWNSCDGNTSVQQIIRKLAKRYNLSLREAQVPTLAFLQTLARKGLIGLTVDDDPSRERKRAEQA